DNKNPERVAAGLKATIHNPTVSKEAKTRAQQRLQEMGVEVDAPASSQHAKETGREMGGYKATLKNPRVSKEAKAHAKEVLKDNDAI
ncbi:Conidiation protein 6-domain-containing protein, partial [Crassisporium funariophilum]